MNSDSGRLPFPEIGWGARRLRGVASRRGILQILGGSGLAAVFGQLGLDGTEAKKKGKKKKKCKGNTTKCGKRACCRADQTCEGGQCVDDVAVPKCVSEAQCSAGQVCQDGICVGKGVE